MSLSKPQIGEEVSVSRTILEEDLQIFARLSLDENPVHFDDSFASKTFFGRRVAHGLLGAALISGALTRLMGEGNVWLSASIQFQKPVFPGDRLECVLRIQEVNRRGVAEISVSIKNQRAESVIAGTVQSMRFLAEGADER